MKIKSVLNSGEIEVIRRLNDEVYTVEFFDKYLSSADKEQKTEASGFLRAVQRAVESQLHIFPKAYVCMFNNVENAVDKFAALSDSFKILMNNTEDLFILTDEEN